MCARRGKAPFSTKTSKPHEPQVRVDTTPKSEASSNSHSSIPAASRIKPSLGIFGDLFGSLESLGKWQAPIQEPSNNEWCADRQLLPPAVQAIKKLPAWVPRPGEIVLFVRRIEPNYIISFDEHTQQYRVQNQTSGKFFGVPSWQAGVVTQSAEEAVDFDDLVQEPPSKQYDENYSGFRVETLPDPNNYNTSMSKQYQYIPLHYIRPFVFWKELLARIPREKLHASIKCAFLATVTVSVLDRQHFDGHWPEAAIYSGGIYIGAELLLPGDFVRIAQPMSKNARVDVLHLRSVRVMIRGLVRAHENGTKTHQQSAIELIGVPWTQDPQASSRKDSQHLSEVPTSLEGYDHVFYPSTSSKKLLCVPFSHAIGRCMDAKAQQLWLPPPSSGGVDAAPLIQAGFDGIIAARAFARAKDSRLLRRRRKWFWADCRAEALGLRSINGFDVPVLDAAHPSEPVSRQPKAALARADHSSLIRTGLEAAVDQKEDDQTAHEAEPTSARKRSRSFAEGQSGDAKADSRVAISLSSDDDEDDGSEGDDEDLMGAVGDFAQGRGFEDSGLEYRPKESHGV